jgi:FdhD protein
MSLPHLAENEQKIARVELMSPGISDIQRSDMVAVEAPLELRLHDKPATILMRPPGHDLELALGFLFHEGIISTSDQVLGVERPEPEHPDHDNILNIRLAIPSRAKSLDRFFFSTSSCGACGKKSLDAVTVQSRPVSGNFIVSPAFLSTLPGRLRPHQELFSQTGGVHASGLFTPDGELVCLREDVGRHNALDKVAGFALERGLHPLSFSILVLSGRVGYEMAQKAIVSGIPIIVAVGAPTSLAIDLCRQFNITLVGFLRGESMNVYTHPERVGI